MGSKLQNVLVISVLLIWMTSYSLAEGKYISRLGLKDCRDSCRFGKKCDPSLLTTESMLHCSWNRASNTENAERTEQLIVCVVIISFTASVCVFWKVRKQKYNTKDELCAHMDRTSWNLNTPKQLRKNRKDKHGEKSVHVQSSIVEQKKATSIVENIQKLKERLECKICLSAYMSIAFLPCSHMVACEKCSMILDRCPVCRAHIKGILPVNT